MKSIRTGFALAAICVVCLGVTEASAQQPYYKDKRLTILINVAPGGATDTEGRLFARHLGKLIEGQPNVIVQHMEGAGGVVAAKYIGEVAPRDGTVVGSSPPPHSSPCSIPNASSQNSRATNSSRRSRAPPCILSGPTLRLE